MKLWYEWTDDEFDERQAALDEALNEHLGRPASEDEYDAEYVMMAFWLPSAGLGAMNPVREQEKLQRVRRLAKELCAAWGALHYDTRSKMEMLSNEMHSAKGHQASYESQFPLSLDLISVLDGVIDVTAPFADKVIEVAPVAGRRDLTNVAVIERLRSVWSSRKAVEAPKSMTEAGPFAGFMIECFEVLRLPGSARAAIDSWREFRARHPKPE